VVIEFFLQLRWPRDASSVTDVPGQACYQKSVVGLRFRAQAGGRGEADHLPVAADGQAVQRAADGGQGGERSQRGWTPRAVEAELVDPRPAGTDGVRRDQC
jgi:hypothetical protein